MGPLILKLELGRTPFRIKIPLTLAIIRPLINAGPEVYAPAPERSRDQAGRGSVLKEHSRERGNNIRGEVLL